MAQYPRYDIVIDIRNGNAEIGIFEIVFVYAGTDTRRRRFQLGFEIGSGIDGYSFIAFQFRVAFLRYVVNVNFFRLLFDGFYRRSVTRRQTVEIQHVNDCRIEIVAIQNRLRQQSQQLGRIGIFIFCRIVILLLQKS